MRPADTRHHGGGLQRQQRRHDDPPAAARRCIIVPAVLGALRLAGRRRSSSTPPFGLWLLVVSIMTMFAVLVGWNALLLHRVDIDRATAERSSRIRRSTTR